MTVTGSAKAASAEPARTAAPGTLHVGRLNVPLSIWLPLAAFALTRLYSFAVISWAARKQVALPSAAHPGIYQFAAHPTSPGYLALITNWDGQWYQRIATLGYHLPAHGAPGLKDALRMYAFLPLFPTVVGAMMTWAGLSFAVCVTIVNVTAGAAAMVVMFALLERTAGWFVASAAVLFTCCFVAAPLLQAAYAESIALLLVCTVLLLVAQRRYGWAVVDPVGDPAVGGRGDRSRGHAFPQPHTGPHRPWGSRLDGSAGCRVRGLGLFVVDDHDRDHQRGQDHRCQPCKRLWRGDRRPVRLVYQRRRAHRLGRSGRPCALGGPSGGSGAQPLDAELGGRGANVVRGLPDLPVVRGRCRRRNTSLPPARIPVVVADGGQPQAGHGAAQAGSSGGGRIGHRAGAADPLGHPCAGGDAVRRQALVTLR